MQARLSAEREKQKQDAERRAEEERIAAEKEEKEEADRRHAAEEERIIAVRRLFLHVHARTYP